MTVVVDASAVVEMLRRTGAWQRVEDAVATGAACAPAHLDAEVLSALARLARADADEEPLVAQRLASLRDAPITRFSCAPLLGDAWGLRTNVAVGDALYVSLAQRLGVPLLTTDGRLARALLGSDVETIVPR